MTFIIIAIILFSIISLGGFAFIIYYIIRKSVKKPSVETISNEIEGMVNRAKAKTVELAAWGNHKSTDLSLNTIYSWKKLITRTANGTLLSDDGKPIVYYERIERGFGSDGHAVAYTTDFNFYFETFFNGSIKLSFNGKPLGFITEMGEIVNAGGQKIGFAKHPKKISIEIERPVFGVNVGNKSFEINQDIRYRLDKNTFPVIMNDSELATIWVAPNFCDRSIQSIVINENFFVDSTVVLFREPSEEEEIWLRAFAILEVCVHGFWFV